MSLSNCVGPSTLNTSSDLRKERNDGREQRNDISQRQTIPRERQLPGDLRVAQLPGRGSKRREHARRCESRPARDFRAPPRQRSAHYIRDDKNHQARRTTASGARERFIKEKRCELSNSSVS